MLADWFKIDLAATIGIVLSTILTYVILIVYTRLLGVRSFSKISSFDYAVTIAFGSILASVAMSPSPSITKGALAMGILFLIQWSVSELRRRHTNFESAIDNVPILLIAKGEMIKENLAKAKMTEYDVYSKIRVKGYANLETIFAMIMETTGDIAIIEHNENIDWALFAELEDLSPLKA